MIRKKNKEQEEQATGDVNKTVENKEDKSTVENLDETGLETGGAKGAETEAAAQNGADSTGYDKLVADLKASSEKLADMNDKYIRLSAEFDNYRKRTLREKMDLSKYAAEELFRKLIPIMDDFDRAIIHLPASTDSATRDGVELIYNKFSEFLKQNGIKEIEAMNLVFDVDLHDAVAKIAVEDDKKGRVVDVVQKGYFLQDKVLRHSKVVVGE